MGGGMMMVDYGLVCPMMIPSLVPSQAQEEFEDFYDEVYEELSKFGGLEEMHVCDNLGDHMVGNVYAKFFDEEHADAALKGLDGR